MEIRKKIIGNHVWEFVNESWSNSKAWGHKTHLLRNGYDYGEHKVRYYNRTWESYRYQTCMSGILSIVYETELNGFINSYKYKNNIDRFKKGQKEEIIKMFEETEIAKQIKELKRCINERDFD